MFPDFKTPVSYENITGEIDPAIEVVKHFKPKKDFAEVVRPYLEPSDMDKLLEIYHDYKENRYNEFAFGVDVLNGLGIELYRSQQVEAALRLFELNVREYPWSPRAHNNLGEVLLEMGENERGMHHLERAFTLHKGYTQWRDLVNENN